MPPARKLTPAEFAEAVDLLPALGSRDILIYDGECRFCIAQASRLQRWAGRSQTGNWLELVALQTPGALAALGIDQKAALAAMQLVTAASLSSDGGKIYSGLAAAVQALRHRPLLGRLALLYYVPGFKQLADLGYRLVARYRYLIMGRAVARGECDGACAIHLRPGTAPPSELERAAGGKVGGAGGGDAAR